MASVLVLGGGVAGLTAAHELVDRGFDVTVVEARDRAGGKARSFPVPGSGTGGRGDLPAEHGFRFFPGFYKHVPHTMGRIPAGGGTVAQHLVGTTRVMLAQAGGRDELVTAAHHPESLGDVEAVTRFVVGLATQSGIPPWEAAWFVQRLLTLLTSCEERRLGQWEQVPWWDFVGAETRSAAFGKFLADGLTRTLVAARAREISTRTGGLVLLQLLFDLTRRGGRADRVLDGPTSDVWIDPWVALLRTRGADVRLGAEVQGLAVRGGRIASATVDGRAMTADHYVLALPVEVARDLVTQDLRRLEPRLGGLDRLVTRWMNGIMFYLDEDVPLVHGHALYIDSPWALTSISQQQFWPGLDLEARGDGRVEGILSVDVSDWERPGPLTGKAAQACTAEEIRAEVWGQLRDHLDGRLREGNVLSWFLDPAIRFPNPSQATNLEPLLINTAGSWADRPEAATAVPNLVLASDYVRTHTDLATMEGANEAARRAVNAILDRERSGAPRCEVWPLREPRAFAAAKALDRLRWRLGRPATPALRVDEAGGLHARGPLGLALERTRGA